MIALSGSLALGHRDQSQPCLIHLASHRGAGVRTHSALNVRLGKIANPGACVYNYHTIIIIQASHGNQVCKAYHSH
jgi:hypothetical protein